MILVVVAGLVTLLIFNINNYINATNRLKDLKDITNLKTYFENYLAKKNSVYANIESSFKDRIDMVISFFNNFKIKGNFQTILANIFNALYTILLIVLNVGVNVFILSYILIKNTIDGTQETIRRREQDCRAARDGGCTDEIKTQTRRVVQKKRRVLPMESTRRFSICLPQFPNNSE